MCVWICFEGLQSNRLSRRECGVKGKRKRLLRCQQGFVKGNIISSRIGWEKRVHEHHQHRTPATPVKKLQSLGRSVGAATSTLLLLLQSHQQVMIVGRCGRMVAAEALEGPHHRSIPSIIRGACIFFLKNYRVNDPSAGSPTETLLRLLLPLSDKVY